MSDEIKLDLDPAKVLQAIADMKGEFQDLAQVIEDSLGKKAKKNIEDLDDNANKGASKIAAYFRNLSSRVREDLKTAFDTTGVMSGLKFGKDIGEGVRQIFDMERAFDRLNTRLMMTSGNLNKFKNDLGKRVAATGQTIQDVLPGVEQAAARGGVKSGSQLAQIGEALGQARASTGEDTAALSETVIEILKNQGQRVTADSFRATLDALQGTRVNGAFENANEAGNNIEALSPYARQFKLSTRELGGLSATASQAGSQGNNILQQLFQQASTPGGMQKMNAILGQNIFKNGKLDAGALGKVDTNRFGEYSQQTLESATGLTGASGADLKRFVEAFGSNMANFRQVVGGANETATQFETATDNLASKFDMFKENVKRSAAAVGEQLSLAANNLMKGEVGLAAGNVAGAAGQAWDNAGTLGAAAGIGLGGAVMAGGSLNRLLGRVGGGAVGAAAAKAAGVEPVFVVNAGEIGDAASGKMGGIFGKMGKLIPSAAALGTGALWAGGAGLAAGAGYLGGSAVNAGVKAVTGDEGYFGAKLYDWMHSDEMASASPGANDRKAAETIDMNAMTDAITTGMLRAQTPFRMDRPDYINKSAVTGTGRAN